MKFSIIRFVYSEIMVSYTEVEIDEWEKVGEREPDKITYVLHILRLQGLNM